MKGRKGFTLIELLIVVAIIAILAAIAIPNFLAAQVRSKVSRAKAESQSLATALESYYIDHNQYPRPDEPNQIGGAETYDGTGTYGDDGGVIPRALTTPVAFISSLFREPFKKNGKGFYEYGGGPQQTGGIGATWPSAGWIVSSYGPDAVDGNSGITGGAALQEETAWNDQVLGFRLETSGLTYDPTNGTTSPGDVWRRGP